MSSASRYIQAIYLEQYVESLAEIRPRLVPRPSIASYVSSLATGSCPEALVHVKITHTAINHVDLLYAHGVHQNNKSGLFEPPFVLGLEFSGIVLDTYTPIGQRCSYKAGDRIWGGSGGCHAEEIVLPSSAVHHVPDSHWSLHDMAAFGAATIPVSYGALTYIARVQPGETVLIHAAAGGLGVYAIQIARALGGKVIATVGSQKKFDFIENLLFEPTTREMAKGEGVVNYASEDWERQVKSICGQDGKEGVDVVFDTVGLVDRSIKCTKFNGRIVVAGFAGRTGTGAEKVQGLEQIAVNKILLKQIRLLGYRFGETGRRLPEETRRMWDELDELLSRTPAIIHPLTYKTYMGLSSVKEAMQALSRREVIGKAIIEVCSEEAAMQKVRYSRQEKAEHKETAAKL